MKTDSISAVDTDLTSLDSVTRLIRGDVLDLSYNARTPHLGSALSCVDVLATLYWRDSALDPRYWKLPERDRVILSKGHAATALYAVLARRGYFAASLLQQYARPGSALVEHPVLGSVPGIEATSGSLGHGLSIGIGFALAGRLQKLSYRVFVILSDGECNEGSVWEAAMFASAHGLNNVVAVVDYNKWQATGRSDEVLMLAPLAEKWRAFGWDVTEVDGHDLNALTALLPGEIGDGDRPVAIIAHTVKGKGVSFMEDDNNWHYRIPTPEEVDRAKAELGLQ